MAHIQVRKVLSTTPYPAFQYLTSPVTLPEQLAGLVRVTWQNPGVNLEPGCEFLFLMERYGVEQPIRFVVDKVVVGHSLSYRQVSGLFASWHHTIKFEDHGQDQTLVTDLVEYEMPFGLMGRLADDFYVRREITRLLKYRLKRAQDKFLGLLNENIKEV